MSDEFVWLMYPANGNTWLCPVGALAMWTGRGWEPCDPPVEPNPTKDPAVALAQPAPVKAGRSKRAAEPAAEPEPTDEPVDDTATETVEGAE